MRSGCDEMNLKHEKWLRNDRRQFEFDLRWFEVNLRLVEL